MLSRLGFSKFAYDYRAEHIPTFEAELAALKRHQIELTAWWFPEQLNDEARGILDVLKRHEIKTQLWVMGGGGPTNTEKERVRASEARSGTHPPDRRGGRQNRLPRRPLQPRRLVRRAREPNRDHRRAEATERRHRLQPASRPRAHGAVSGTPEADAAASLCAQSQRHGARRRAARAVDSAPRPGRSRSRFAQDDSRQRLPRPDRNSRAHAGRCRRATARQSRRPRLAREATRRAAGRCASQAAHVCPAGDIDNPGGPQRRRFSAQSVPFRTTPPLEYNAQVAAELVADATGAWRCPARNGGLLFRAIRLPGVPSGWQRRRCRGAGSHRCWPAAQGRGDCRIGAVAEAADQAGVLCLAVSIERWPITAGLQTRRIARHLAVVRSRHATGDLSRQSGNRRSARNRHA